MSVSYVQKKSAAVWSCAQRGLQLRRTDARRNARRTAHDNAPYALVDAIEASGLEEPLRGLQTRLDGVDWEEEQVYGCAR